MVLVVIEVMVLMVIEVMVLMLTNGNGGGSVVTMTMTMVMMTMAASFGAILAFKKTCCSNKTLHCTTNLYYISSCLSWGGTE